MTRKKEVILRLFLFFIGKWFALDENLFFRLRILDVFRIIVNIHHGMTHPIDGIYDSLSLSEDKDVRW